MTARRVAALLSLMLAACGRPAAPPAGARAYVTNELSGDLSVIDIGARRTIGRIALGKRPRGIVASPDGRILYIALSGSPVGGPGVDESALPPPDRAADGIAVFDIDQGRVVRVIRGVSDPETVAVSPDGHRLYVCSEDSGRLIVLDADGGGLLAAIPVGGEPEGVAVSPHGDLVYATSEADNVVTVIEAGSLRVRARIPVGRRPRNAVFTSDGRRALVPGESDGTITALDVAASRPVGSVHLAGENMRPMGVALSRDGRSLFVTTGRGRQLLRLDPATLGVNGRVEVGDRPWGLALSPDGGFIMTANGPSNDVTMVDAASLRVVARIPVGDRPWGVAIPPSR